jgi:hypothetical protein
MLKRHKCPWHEWSKNQSDFVCTDLLSVYFGRMTIHILYKYQSLIFCKHDMERDPDNI